MLWGGRWEGGSCLGTHVRIKDLKKKILDESLIPNIWLVFLTCHQPFIVVRAHLPGFVQGKMFDICETPD